MARRSFLLGALIFLSFLAPRLASAQYMYIDTDGDGIHGSADRLNSEGPTVLTIYLDTSHDRDGTEQSCNSHTASCGATTSSQPLDMFGYTLSIVAVGGTVEWGTFTAADGAYTALGSDVSDTTSIELTRSRPPQSFTPAGLVTIGSIPVTILSGTPRIEFAHEAIAADPNGFGTGFATECGGNAYSNTYVLGDPENKCASGGDWFDTDGAAEADLPPQVNAPASIIAVAGQATTVDVSATDPNGQLIDVLSADLSGLPTGDHASFTEDADHAHGQLSWTPSAGETGTYTITFSASNTLTGETTTQSSVESSVTGRTVRIQMPAPGYRVDVSIFDAACAGSGGLCSQDTYYSGDSGQVYVPLMRCSSPTSCAWWDRVLIGFPAWTTSAFVSTSLSGNLDLYPSSNAAQRPYNYTPTVDPWLVTTFDYFAKVQSFYTERFGIARGSIGLFLFDQGSTEGPEYDNQEDRIWWPHYPEYFNSSASYPGPWVAAHEYMHAIEYVVYGQPGDCSVTSENCFADNIFGHTFCFSCATHYACGSVQSRKGSWNEALGDAAGELFYRTRYNPAGSGFAVETPCSPTGPDKEGSIAGYLYTLMARDSHAFMNTFRSATITYTGEGLDHAKTVEVFKALWDDVDPPQGVIVDHHPGNWNTSALYSYYITGGVAGVDPRQCTPGVPVLRASPNPVSRTLLVEGTNLPAHLQLQLYDVSGRLIQSRRLQLPPTGSLSTRLATDQLPTGVYFLRTLSDQGKEVTPGRKVVILR